MRDEEVGNLAAEVTRSYDLEGFIRHLRYMLLKLQSAYESVSDLVKNADLGSEGLGWNPRVSISNRLLGDTCANGPWATL